MRYLGTMGIITAMLALVAGTARLFAAPATDVEGAMTAGGSARPIAGGDRGGSSVGSNACANAPDIFGFGAFGFDLAGTTTDGVAHSACLAFESIQIWRDVWHRWQSPVSGVVHVATCNQTTVDTRIAVYSPAAQCVPGSEYLLGCNDDSCGTQSQVSFVAQAGQIYLVRLGRFGASEPPAAGSGFIVFSSDAAAFECEGTVGCQDPDFTQSSAASNENFRVADDVTTPSTGVIEGLCWWGNYPAQPAVTDAFTVTYWTDSNGRPGTPIASFEQSTDLAVQRVHTGIVGLALDLSYQYSAHHEPVPVADGQRVWVEIRNFIGAPWYWQGSTLGNSSWQDATPTSNWGNSVSGHNRALCLKVGSNCTSDINGDGQINFSDLNAVISQFNADCP